MRNPIVLLWILLPMFNLRHLKGWSAAEDPFQNCKRAIVYFWLLIILLHSLW
jgi:hypothetical protein